MAETVSGGYYIGEDGRPHDAFGRPLGVSRETATDGLDGLRQAQAAAIERGRAILAKAGVMDDAPSAESAGPSVKKGRRK